MTGDKEESALIEALKRALAEPGEQRLYRSGKLPGLFANRTGANATAAERAVADGLLEIVRTEDKGKQPVEWVRPTPAGVSFLHAHEAPRAVLEELQAALQTTKAGVPIWLEGIQQEIEALNGRLAGEMEKLVLYYLDRRRQSGAAGDCPLPELFAALRQHRPDITLPEFHDGLRRLDDLRAIALRPFTGKPEELAEPEYALPDGGTVLYYVNRERD